MKKIIFIETSDVGAFYTAEGARILGYKPLFLCDINKIQGDTRLQLESERLKGNVIVTETISLEQILAALRLNDVEEGSVAGVMTFLDSRLEIAIHLAKALNCTHALDPAILLLKSKTKVQSLVPEWSPPSLVLTRNQFPFRQVEELVNFFGKVIVKPSKTAGAIGTQIFNQANFKQIPKELLASDLPGFLDDNEWICQAFIEGELVSVEGFVKQNNITILGISDRSKIGFTESKLEFPVDAKFSQATQDQFVKALADICGRSRFQNGFFHVEFIVTPSNVYVIDANFGRLGGGPIGEIIPMALGIDIAEFYSFVISCSLPNLPNTTNRNCIDPTKISKSEYRPTVGICYGSSTSGYFESLTVKTAVEFKHTLLLDTNQEIPAMGANNWGWIGLISSYKENFQADLNSLKFKINNVECLPCF